MAELYPLELSWHLRRILSEFQRQRQVYDLPLQRFWKPAPGLDLSVDFQGQRASTAFGPAAGPQTQLLQNILLSWLGGARIIELKTIQTLDQLQISRPCIYAGNLGYNVEWSQELRLEQSLLEYVGASMVIDILCHHDPLGLGPEWQAAGQTIFDLSVGYDLKGISSPPVTDFIRSLLNAQPLIDKLLQTLPPELKWLKTTPFKHKIINSVTLSTFHGCPKEEIESICQYLLRDLGVHTIVKLNPTQLERNQLETLLHSDLGYTHLTVNPKAWETSLSLSEAHAIIERLEPQARSRNLNIGVKFSNTLEVLNSGDYLKDEVMYLSGPPLHLVAMMLVEQWRKKAGNRFPITFAAGIDRENFPDAVALGLKPITVCTDLLKTRGYARSLTYLSHLEEKMLAIGAKDIPSWILLARGQAQQALERLNVPAELQDALIQQNPSLSLEQFCQKYPELHLPARQLFDDWVSQTSLLNTTAYLAVARGNPRYHWTQNRTPPKKVNSALSLLDCLACGKCVPVCPNDANFSYRVLPQTFEGRNFKVVGNRLLPQEAIVLKAQREEQWAVYADFCNECGNCDTFCPEEGGPFAQKAKFFGSRATFEKHRDRDGFLLENGVLWGRWSDRLYRLELNHDNDQASFHDSTVEVSLRASQPTELLSWRILTTPAEGHILNMKYYFWMKKSLEGVLNPSQVNYINLRQGHLG